MCKIFRVVVFAVSALATCLAFSEPNDWSSWISSSRSKFRGGTSSTPILLYAMPEWSRVSAADLDLISKQPASLSALHDGRRKFVPLSVQGFEVGSVLGLQGALKAPTLNIQELATKVDDAGGGVQRGLMGLHTYYLMQNFAFSAHVQQQRNLWLKNSNTVMRYQLFRDFGLQLSAGTPMYDDPDVGRFDIGFAARGFARVGSDKTFNRASISPTDVARDRDFFEQSLAVGLDLSLLWSSPGVFGKGWGLQLAAVGRDLGTTAFLKPEPLFKLLGFNVDTSRRFPIIANDTILGAGLKLPNFRDGIRSALRLEYNQWTRPNIAFGDRVSASYELRLPQLAHFAVGYTVGGMTAGVGLRFQSVELDLGTGLELWNREDSLEKIRSWVFELRASI